MERMTMSTEWTVGCGHEAALVQVNGGGEEFQCRVCKEYGRGARVGCSLCESYEVHRLCADAPAAISMHPLHPHHMLLLCPNPPKGGGGGSAGGPKCSLCHKPCRGHAFRCCSACSFQLHPCCAALAGPTPPQPPLHHHPLCIAGPTSDSSTCILCRRKRSGRVFRCYAAGCDYQMHAVCAKDAFNGLQPNHNSGTARLSNAARLASQVMMDFIEGLIEGIAEGVGQVIAQDALKGSRSKNKSNNNNKPT